MKTLLIAFLALAAGACAEPRRPDEQAATVATPRPTPAAKPPATPPPIDQNAKTDKGSGAFDRYRFTFEKTGAQVVADFPSPRLPYNDNVVVGAAREVINAAYGEKMENFPRRVAWSYRESRHAIKLEGKDYDYVFVHVSEDKKEIPTIIFWRVAKGTVD